MRRSTCLTTLLLAIILLTGGGCPSPRPDAPAGDDPRRDDPGADKYLCHDLDGDGFSFVGLCPPADCNDEHDFIGPEGGYCEAYPYLECDPHDGWLAADFCAVPLGRSVHVYYIKGFDWLGRPDTDGKAFGHEATTDGLAWEFLGDDFAVDPQSDWDDAHVWAPCIVRNPADGLYYLFYTGVTFGDLGHEERIGLAVSPNLRSWTRVPLKGCEGKTSPGCLWEPDFPWCAWPEPGGWTKQCRDPHVYRDEAAGCWYLTYATALAPFDWTMVIALARSEDLREWEDLGPIPVTAGPCAESPHLFSHEGTAYLLWTIGGDGGSANATCPDPGLGGWSPRWVIPGSRQEAQIACEVMEWDDQLVYGYVHQTTRNLRFGRLALEGGLQPGPLAGLECSFWPASRVHPWALEIPNGIDDNCNGAVDEAQGPCRDEDGDLFGDPASDSCPRLGLDCDDGDPAVHPGAAGSCDNGVDDNCNGWVDETAECLPKFPAITDRY